MERYTVKIGDDTVQLFADDASDAFNKAMQLAKSRGFTGIEPPIREYVINDYVRPSLAKQLGYVAYGIAVAVGASLALYHLMVTLTGV